jgi:hypothetical protein
LWFPITGSGFCRYPVDRWFDSGGYSSLDQVRQRVHCTRPVEAGRAVAAEQPPGYSARLSGDQFAGAIAAYDNQQDQNAQFQSQNIALASLIFGAQPLHGPGNYLAEQVVKRFFGLSEA